ncbi:TSC22 domain family protein 4 isoform X2 [Heterocephalus glaber]|uniref:TSC22 domain family protein 4 isoform X2 n=1 Tax=Heterocephalus glaber TaxID=10181 RepID=A0AAX6QU82_HETGA|nr:TSC22 domain family protein 4 isoform X2 [Heterocephalus glaber]
MASFPQALRERSSPRGAGGPQRGNKDPLANPGLFHTALPLRPGQQLTPPCCPPFHSGSGARVRGDPGTDQPRLGIPAHCRAVGGGPRVPEEPIATWPGPGGGGLYISQASTPGPCLFSACLAPAGPHSAWGALSPPPGARFDTALSLWGRPEDPCTSGMAQPGLSVKSLVSSYETRVVETAPGPPRKKGCVSSPCSPRGASPIRGAPGPPHHRGLGGPGQWPSPCRGVDKTLLPLILYCHSSSSMLTGIDNKIEQAMDLVKSHLMFAVREEVEVLKEQIRDLAERNAALEQENSLLRALASPEQLAQLPSSGLPRLGPPAPNGPSI